SALSNVQLGLDVISIFASMLLAANLHARLRPIFPVLRGTPLFHEHATLVYLVLPLWFTLIVVFGVHRTSVERVGHAELLVRLIKLHLAGLVGLALIQFLTQAIINRSLVALFLLCTFLFMYAQRSVWLAWARFQYARTLGPERVLLVGLPSRRMSELVRAASAQRHPPRLMGYLEVSVSEPGLSVPPPDAPSLPCLGKLADLTRLLHEQPVDHVLFFPPANQPERVREQLVACEQVGVTASFSVDLVQLAQATPRVTSKYDHAFITFDVAPKRPDALAIKYGLDPLLAALLLLLLSPLLAVLSLLIWASMGRPVLFVQTRAGLHGRPFRMLKFRSMSVDAENRRAELGAENEMSGPVFKIKEDPRVTSLGRWLRKTSLDELPQLWNVVTGSMSLVGPRPLPAAEQAAIQGWQRRRLSMKPGITCLWQVGGRNDVDFVDWMLLDLKYVDEWSLWLDLLILLKTVPVVLLGRGAS
ncbi:MAG TPA: exopolysaccharide biosynthesis polyprenyl glycosylphosphotransferase, partial [Polyangiales bacterium]